MVTSVLTTTLMKVAYAGESQMLVEDALNRMDEVLNAKELPEAANKQKSKDAYIT